MSQTNSPGEEDDRRDSISEDFEFYFPFAKTLALDLPAPEDTSIAAAWVQKLEAEPESEEEKRTRLNYLKLLLFVLQRGRLSGIFRKQPPSGALQPFPQGLSILDMGNLMLEQDDTPVCGEGDARCIPYTTEISNDLREFVASQEIPNFGVQMYYAWSSDEPVHKWLSFDEEKFPQFVLDKIKQLKEVKSDDKSTVAKNGCVGPKTGCDLPLIDKCAKKKVKSPQEIEKSQGRSFHTYVGLVGRMGNFSDKCGDDPDKCQRQDSRKGKCPRRNLLKQYPGSGGEAEEMPMEDDLTNFLAGAGGLNTLNRPCLCPVLGGHPHYPEHCGKGGPQHFQEQQTPRMNYTFPVGYRKQQENFQWNSAERPLAQRRYNEEQCPEIVPQPMPSQRRSASPRPKSNSSNRPNVDCPPQDDGGCSNPESVCSCTSPPCTCPCPRAVSQGPMRKPSSMNAATGGRGPMDPSLACSKQGAGGYRMSREDPCPGGPQGPEPGPSGAGRSGVAPRPSGRTKSPKIIHCFDGHNPDPCLTQTISKLESLNWSEDGQGNAFPNDNGNECFANEKSAQPTFQKAPPQREVYDPCQQQSKVHSPTCPAMAGMKQKSDRCSPPVAQGPRTSTCARSPRSPSPQAAPRPVCQVPQEPPQQCRPSQQFTQNYQECARPAQARPVSNNACGGQAPDPCRPPSRTANQPENLYAFLDKYPPDCPGLTPPPFENVFGKPAADSCPPSSPHWNQPEYLYDFMDKFPPNAPGYNAAGFDEECGAPAADPCRPPSQSGNQREDPCAYMGNNEPSPAGLTGKPPRMRSGINDVCGRPAADPCRPQSPIGNQPEDLCAFMEKHFPQNPSGPCPSGKPTQMRPGLNDVFGRPGADSCRPPSQAGNQPEDPHAFMEKHFPQNASGSCAPGRKSGRMATVASLLQGINQRREAHREKCDQSGPRKPQANDGGFCQSSGQPPANVCPEQALPPSGAMLPNCCADSRPPRAPVCPDTGACRRHQNAKSPNMDKCPRSPPNRVCANHPVSLQGKTATFMSQQSHPSRQPIPSAYGNAGQEACDADGEEEDECESSESAGEVCSKESVPTYELPCESQKSPGRSPQQAQGPCGPQGMMPGRSPQQQPCSSACPGIQSGASLRPMPGRTGRNETCRPNREAEMGSCAPQRVTSGKTPQQEQCNYRVGEIPSSTPKRISAGKAYGQEAAVYREPNVQTGSRPKTSPGKAAQEQCNVEWESMQAGNFQVPTSPRRKTSPGKAPQEEYNVEWESMQAGNFQMQTGPRRKTSPGKAAQEEYNEDWDDMPSSASRMGSYGYKNEPVSNKEAEKQAYPSGKASPGKASMQGANANECLVMPGNAAQMPSTSKAAKQEQNPEEWCELGSEFTEKTSSRGSRKDDETPTWAPLVWGRKSPEPEGSGPKEGNGQSCGPSQRKSPGRVNNQDPAQNANATYRISPRKTSQQVSCKEGMPPCCSQGQQNVQDCTQYAVPDYRGNPYVESSITFHRNRRPLVKSSTPREWLGSVSQNNVPGLSTIIQYDSQCEYDTNDQVQSEFCEEDDDTTTYMPLYSLNADLSAGKFFNFPETAPRNEQCPQDVFFRNCAPDNSRNNHQEVSFQTFQAEDVYCDNTENGFY